MATEYLNHIAFDSVVFGFSGQTLKILIMEYHNTGLFALPGGFVQMDENLNDAVKRGLKERTGLDNIYLEQFYTFGDVARYQPEIMAKIIQANELEINGWEWLLERFISVAYYALINYNDVVPQPDALSDSCEWYPVNELPPLMLDHAEIVAKALETLRTNLDQKLIGGNLLPERFTMQELQNVYEAILDTKLHRSAFQRKLLASDQLVRHEKRFTGKAHKAPYLYSFKPL
ncbi:MAG TPA: NUDIX domain-containing protein [Saprospiraceae bacterium]|nr:NUDIX hydrolase [Saprospiraceae bacterium]HPG06519.1 NUDIX domain-containing protein [Saprospiraceae bacterium]HPQ99813.1 NUDIX domain-containing protein [Saprospiraceae bacterium]HQU53213.1 NUDIX domain-containing protein [Saprospiraceae bacterium]HRV83954.1 NUDIX domain-containing protein [Saprospiraceae bacterium]